MFLRKIIDIKIEGKKINLSREAEISVLELENQISELEYSGESLPKYKAEEDAKLPPFIQSFYYLFFKDIKVPKEQTYIETYLDWLGGVSDGKIKYNNTLYESAGITARMKRTYPSLIRDLHFTYLLEESRLFDKVEYSMQTDYFNGLDLKIEFSKKVYFISIFIDTSHGKYYKSRKTNRHDYTQVNEIIFNVNFDELKKVGKFYLLHNDHVEQLKSHLI